jgi:serine O-acetyltransferase
MQGRPSAVKYTRRPVVALWLWRRSIWCHRHGLKLPSRFFKTLNFLVFGAVLEPEVELEGHVNLSHRGLGVVVHGSTRIGAWAQIWQYATIAASDDKNTPNIGVRIGRGAVIGAHSIIMCPAGRTLTIGEEAVIAAGAIVVDDVPPRAVALPEPSRIIMRESALDQASMSSDSPRQNAP